MLNARGEPVPHAWVDEEPVAPDRREQNVPFFKAPAAASAVDAAQQGGWIIDLRAVKGALLELQLSVPPNEHGIYGFALEYGDDLQQWHTLVGAAQLLSLQHQGLRLEHTAFDLGGLRARYLRLRPLPGSTPPPLTGARVSSVTRYAPVAPLQWSEWLAPTQCSAQSCDYALPRHLPLERLEWQLADANTLAPVDLLVQYDNSETNTSGPTPWRHHHLLRDPLKSLRHKTAPAPTETSCHSRETPAKARMTPSSCRSLPRGSRRRRRRESTLPRKATSSTRALPADADAPGNARSRNEGTKAARRGEELPMRSVPPLLSTSATSGAK